MSIFDNFDRVMQAALQDKIDREDAQCGHAEEMMQPGGICCPYEIDFLINNVECLQSYGPVITRAMIDGDDKLLGETIRLALEIYAVKLADEEAAKIARGLK